MKIHRAIGIINGLFVIAPFPIVNDFFGAQKERKKECLFVIFSCTTVHAYDYYSTLDNSSSVIKRYFAAVYS
jgi:hypothetical protein